MFVSFMIVMRAYYQQLSLCKSMHEEHMEEKCKKDQEEIQKRIEEVECREAKEREADRERKRERARRAKEVGPEAIRKEKYPWCAQ